MLGGGWLPISRLALPFVFFFQAEDGIRDFHVTGVQTCALPILAKHYMLGSFHQAAETFEIMVNKDLYDGLPEELQAIIRYGVEAANTANFSLAMDNYSTDLQALIEAGVNVHRTPTSVFQAQLEAWDAVVEKFGAEDEFFTKVIDSQKEWFERVCYYMLTNQAEYELAYNHYWPNKLPTAGRSVGDSPRGAVPGTVPY